MLYVVPFQAEHFRQFKLQPAQVGILEHLSDEQLRVLEGRWANTLMLDGRPIAAGGAWEIWANRAYLWSYVGTDVERHLFRQAHTFVRQFIDSLPHRRIEASVKEDFEAGHRWMKALGFKCETPEPMRAFQADGADARLYSLVRN